MIKLAELLDEKKGRDLNDDNIIDSEDWKVARNMAIKKSKNTQNENHFMSNQPSMDHEAKMAKGELRDMLMNGAKLYQMIEPGENLPGWVSAYITLASDYIHSVTEYMTQEYSEMQEGQEIATNYQFTPEQFTLLKKYGAKKLGSELLIPDLVKIDLDNNKTNSKFKTEFFELSPNRAMASQILSALNKALKKVKLEDKVYWSLEGHTTDTGNFNFPNPYRTKK